MRDCRDPRISLYIYRRHIYVQIDSHDDFTQVPIQHITHD